MKPLTFTETMLIRDGNPYIPVTAEQARMLKAGWRKPMPVLVAINGKPETPWRINMMPAGDGSFYLYLHGEVRKASRTSVGDVVEVRVRFDAGYRGGPMHPMPDGFAQALRRNAKAKAGWTALIPSRKKEILRYLAGLKSDAARERNIEKAVAVLAGEAGRFMARDWKEGR